MMRRFLTGGVLLGASLVADRAHALDTQACLEASQRGQEARDSGKLIESRQLFTTCGDSTCPQPVPTYCADWLKDVNRRIPSLVFRVTDGKAHDLVDVTTTLDGVVVSKRLDGRPIDVNPGTHQLVFEQGSARVEQTLLVVESEKGRVVTTSLDLTSKAEPVVMAPPRPPTAPAADRPIPTASWVGWGVGAAGLLGFGVFGLQARSTFDDYKASCGSRCTSDDRDSVKQKALVADVFLAVGIIGATVGTIFYLTRPSAERRSGRLTMDGYRF